MTNVRITRTGLGVIALLATASTATIGCGKQEAAPEAEQTGATTKVEAGYAFELPRQGDTMERIDAMGVALTSTVLMNRDRNPLVPLSPPGGADNDNQYQRDTPDVQLNPKTAIIFLHFLRKLHTYWRDQLEGLGYETCSTGLLFGNVLATPCTLQRIRMKGDTDVATGPRVIDAVMPDYVSLDLDLPLGFPNGRPPWEPVSDKILAMGFLKMGGKCPGNAVCNIETFVDLPLQVSKNDRPFKATSFPYLAEPWFYKNDGKDSYYWPTTARLESPE